ncbi:MAG: hypothetical protein ACREQZ_09325 [Woeseiaceae bacterium]
MNENDQPQQARGKRTAAAASRMPAQQALVTRIVASRTSSGDARPARAES